MKKFLDFIFILLIISVFISCSKEKNPVGAVDKSGTLSFKSDGNQVSYSETLSEYHSDEDETEIHAGSGTSFYVSVFFPGKTTGTYVDTGRMGYVVDPNDLDLYYRSKSINVTVTAYEANGRIKGTFSGILSHRSGTTMKITEGQFDVYNSTD